MIQAEQLHARVLEELDMSREIEDEELTVLIHRILKEVSDRFNSRNYMLVSYKMERLGSGDTERYIVTMVIKSKRSNDEGHMLSLMQEWPDVTVEQIE